MIILAQVRLQLQVAQVVSSCFLNQHILFGFQISVLLSETFRFSVKDLIVSL